MASVHLPPPPPPPPPPTTNLPRCWVGSFAVGTTVTQGPNVSVPPDHAIVIMADLKNTGTIHILGNNQQTEGFPLRGGDAALLKINNLNGLWFIADRDHQIIRFIVEATQWQG